MTTQALIAQLRKMAADFPLNEEEQHALDEAADGLEALHEYRQARRAYDDVVETRPQPANYGEIARRFEVAEHAILENT